MLFLLAVPTLSAEGEQVSRELYDSVSASQFEKFWIDSYEILDNLDQYSAFWIKPHGCVWSECAVDDTDDGYTGDNRDGDEQWYQYRTQEFCANAAYSLYGIKRGSIGVFGCSRYHFINSFFTYGGADTLLKVVGKTPKIYYDSYNGGDNGNNNNNNGYYESSNAQCVAIDNGNGNGQNQHRDLGGSGDGNNGYSSSLGCDADGKYVMATFASDECDGNYFLEIADTFDSYNRQHNSVHCHKVWSRGDKSSYDNIHYLLNNSWSCDLDLYPNGCPDPYGEKARYDFALKTISRGGNAQAAYRHMKWKRPLRFLSSLFVIAAFGIMSFTYRVKNIDRIRAKGGSARGYLRCVVEDMGLGLKAFLLSLRNAIKKAIKRRKSKRKKKSSKKRKSRKSKTTERETQDPPTTAFEDEEAPRMT